jgi:excisionase family DNA binding protein
MTLSTINPNELLSVNQTAELLDVSVVTVYAMIKRGELHPLFVAERTCFHKPDVEALKAKRQE